ncbi:hypothetical protein FB471_4267 [Amycolatopsis cihanbeyliensis]|uniref:Uncharacterized protein n=1 Tax=Amycolatopsis cihanbeyliensis TaxID=1128664 RepID=A0A542DMZ4_AMYCI|nr:hypothetical protein FB471_4267 [Amycolatopsis cihanbeyliensis]
MTAGLVLAAERSCTVMRRAVRPAGRAMGGRWPVRRSSGHPRTVSGITGANTRVVRVDADRDERAGRGYAEPVIGR